MKSGLFIAGLAQLDVQSSLCVLKGALVPGLRTGYYFYLGLKAVRQENPFKSRICFLQRYTTQTYRLADKQSDIFKHTHRQTDKQTGLTQRRKDKRQVVNIAAE